MHWGRPVLGFKVCFSLSFIHNLKSYTCLGFRVGITVVSSSVAFDSSSVAGLARCTSQEHFQEVVKSSDNLKLQKTGLRHVITNNKIQVIEYERIKASVKKKKLMSSEIK